jgi:hypothetical protein
MPAYTAYGLRIESDIHLPDLVSESSRAKAPDVLIRRGSVNVSPADGGDDVCRRVSPEEVCIHYEGVASLLIQRGALITIDVPDTAPAGLLRLVLLGPALGVILHQRGFLVLHSSAVRIGDRAVAFVGHKTAGKSTTAAAFNSRGYPLIADDILAVSPKTFLVHPAFPILKLWAEVAGHLHGQTADLEQFHPSMEKFAVPASGAFATAPSRLSAVFSLADAEKISIETLPPQKAFMELVRNSYLLSLLRSTNTAATHFRQAVSLAAAVSVCRLARPRSLAALDELVSTVVSHVA